MQERLSKIIAEQLGIDATEVTADKHLIDDLGADSLDIVELIMAVEEEFSVEIPDEDAEGLRTVGDMLAYLASKTQG